MSPFPVLFVSKEKKEKERVKEGKGQWEWSHQTGRIIEFGNPGSFEDLNGLALNQQMQQHIEPCRMKDEMKLSIADILHKLFKASDGEDQKQICCAVSQVRLKKYQFALVES
ncbi:hypothetical protein V6N13_037795 [Hibiscus sabdariffa]